MHHPHPSLYMRSIWNFTLKFFVQVLEVDIYRTFNWILLILCLMLDIGLTFYALPSPCIPTPLWPWGQGHVHRIFLINEMFISQFSHQKAFIFQIESASIQQLLTPGCMPWGGARSKYRTSWYSELELILIFLSSNTFLFYWQGELCCPVTALTFCCLCICTLVAVVFWHIVSTDLQWEKWKLALIAVILHLFWQNVSVLCVE